MVTAQCYTHLEYTAMDSHKLQQTERMPEAEGSYTARANAPRSHGHSPQRARLLSQLNASSQLPCTAFIWCAHDSHWTTLSNLTRRKSAASIQRNDKRHSTTDGREPQQQGNQILSSTQKRTSSGEGRKQLTQTDETKWQTQLHVLQSHGQR